jgi:hypothetical protein
MPTIFINSYAGVTGHVNVTFVGPNGMSSTYGVNTKDKTGVNDEAHPWNRSDLVSSHAVEVSQAAYDAALLDAENLWRETERNQGNYDLWGNNCVDFADRILQKAGLPEHSITEYADRRVLTGVYADARAGLHQDSVFNDNGFWGKLVDESLTSLSDQGLDLWEYAKGKLRATGDLLRAVMTDPLIIDLDGDGFELIPVASSSAFLDLNGDGYAERVGWIGPDDGFLVVDKDRDGVVDGLSELVGNATTDGFDVLRTYDANGDLVIDANDDVFASLLVWRDLDGNGQSTADEIASLGQLDPLGLQSKQHAFWCLVGGQPDRSNLGGYPSRRERTEDGFRILRL